MSDNKSNAKTALHDAHSFIARLDTYSEAYTPALRNIKDLEPIPDANPRLLLHRPHPVVGPVRSFVGIVANLTAEQIFPVASKALGFVAKIRI